MRCLITANYPQEAQDELASWGPVAYEPWTERGTLLNGAGLIARLKETSSDLLITEIDRVSADLLDEVPLRAVGVCRGTPVNVDIEAATARGIPVFRTPGRNAEAVAELALAMTLTLLRRLPAVTAAVRDGRWTHDRMTLAEYRNFMGHELSGKTVGLVGFGAVAQSLARLLVPFHCVLRYYDPYVAAIPQELEDFAQPASLVDLFSMSDVVSVHLPLSADTRGLIDATLIAKMRPTSLFINTSRAAVISRVALYDALRAGRIGGAGLDVFDHEPLDDPEDQALATLPNVVATPHIGGATWEVPGHQARILNAAFRAWREGRMPPELVNPIVWERGITAWPGEDIG